jgi:SAM-dependent methyltransferase
MSARQNDEMTETFDLSERCYPSRNQKRVVEDHMARYRFASQFVRDKRVIDIGCGEGYGSNVLAVSGAASVLGADADPEIIKHAAQTYSLPRFVVMDATATGLPDAQFDIAICFEVWHHLDRHERLLPEIRRILKPGGLLICSVPNSKVIYLNPFHRKMFTPFYRRDFTRSAIEKVCRGYFSIEAWYGQRFVRRWYVYAPVRLLFWIVGHIWKPFAQRMDRSYKLGSGPEPRPLEGENARILMFVGRA